MLFRSTLAGVAREVRPNARLLGDVRIQITGGPEAGKFAMTDANGVFKFEALASGLLSIDATKDGYLLWRIANLGFDGDRTIEVDLYPTPPMNASGASATARCMDGTWSWATSLTEACAANGGVAYTTCPGPLCSRLTN